jgi:putative transposase
LLVELLARPQQTNEPFAQHAGFPLRREGKIFLHQYNNFTKFGVESLTIVMSLLNYKLFYQRHLPHYQPPEAILFVTFRLAGSLPREVLDQLARELESQQIEINKIGDLPASKTAIEKTQKILFGKFDNELDYCYPGPKWLAEPAIAEIVCEALHYRDGRQYTLEAYSIMPNHVHLVCSPLVQENGIISLAKIMQSLKGFTARKANQVLGRQGAFWQHESYDHVVRNQGEFQRIVHYVLENPVRAGIPARWIYSRRQE